MLEKVREGVDRREAILSACRVRARPIIMTSVAMTAGMLPIALGIGLDTAFREPMAIVVIGGLVSSTALSLLFMPVIFSDTRGLEERVMARMRRRAERDGHHEPLPEQA